MTNPMFSPQPSYSGVTIQIANPTVNAGQYPPPPPQVQGGYVTVPQVYGYQPQCYSNNFQVDGQSQGILTNQDGIQAKNQEYPSTYPAQYYLNNYNYPVSENGRDAHQGINSSSDSKFKHDKIQNETPDSKSGIPNEFQGLRHYDTGEVQEKEQDFTKSNLIKEDLDKREAEIEEKKKNTKEKQIVALTDEYIKSLENYLNNPNKEIRLMASKEILTRLDEDKDRYDDAALNALLNKMLQDPSKLIRVAALSAFASQLASGNEYTVTLLHNIQSNPNADKEDVLQAADILLKMSSGREIKNIPEPEVKENITK